MLAAHAKGLGSCWIGFSEKLLNTPEFKLKHDIPSSGLARIEYPVFGQKGED